MNTENDLFAKLVRYFVNLCSHARLVVMLAKKVGDERKEFIKHCKEDLGLPDSLINHCININPPDREIMLSTATAIGLMLSGDKDIYKEVKRLQPEYCEWWEEYYKEQEEKNSKVN